MHYLSTDPTISTTGSDYNIKAAKLGDNETFTCSVCSYPEARTYEWSFNGTKISEEESIDISDIHGDDYSNYTCIVSNEINAEQRPKVLVYHLQPVGKNAFVVVLPASPNFHFMFRIKYSH